MDIKIKRITKSDGDSLRKIRLSALKNDPDVFGATYSEESSKPVSDFHRMASRHTTSDRSTTFLGWSGNNVIGQIGALFENDQPFICAMWVSPMHRRNSIGALLLKSAQNWLAQNGASEIYAWVFDSNFAAQGFYKNLGFKSTNQTQQFGQGRSETLFCIKLPDANE